MTDENVMTADDTAAEGATETPQTGAEKPTPAPEQGGVDKAEKMVYNSDKLDAVLAALEKLAPAAPAGEGEKEPGEEVDVAAERDALKAELEAMKAKQQMQEWAGAAMKEHDLPAAAAQFLHGGTEEEVKNTAKALKELITSSAGRRITVSGDGKPREGARSAGGGRSMREQALAWRNRYGSI